MNTRVKNAIIAAARANPTEEVCGFIYQTAREVLHYPCANISQDEAGRAGSFEIDPQDYIKVRGLGRPCGVYHSHPKDEAVFSEEDLAVAEDIGLPFHVYAVQTEGWVSYVPPTYYVNPIGRTFAWGEADCYEVVRLHYRQSLGIYLTDYDRDETFRDAHPNAIVEHIEAEGFTNLGRDIKLARIHDVLLFESDGRRYPHHLGVCVGGSRLLHHRYGGLSRTDDIDESWLKCLVGVCRYVGEHAERTQEALTTVSL